MHRYRIAFISGLAAGFVLGTRAGRERYEQMRRVASKVAGSPAAQQAVAAIQNQVTGLAGTARAKVTGELSDRVPRMAEAARHKVTAHLPGHAARHPDGSADARGSAGNSAMDAGLHT
jgi:hypothetical protein